MHVYTENLINETNKIYIILEILGGGGGFAPAPSIGATVWPDVTWHNVM